MNSAVIDASVAVKWVVAEELAPEALLLHRLRQMFAPAHWLAEATNALWAKARRGELTGDEAERSAAILRRAPVSPIPVPDLQPDALRLALSLGHPVYDCLYLALAAERMIPLVTADRRLYACGRQVPDPSLSVVWLGDVEAAMRDGR